jgi:protoporphyrinogen oxidase
MGNEKKSDICVIGAGIGGLTAGALLTKQGYKVKIFEKEPLIGGRALSLDTSSLTLENYKEILSRFYMHVPFSEPDLETIFNNNMLNGYKLDLGYHAIGGGAVSHINSVLSEFDKHLEMLESNTGFIKPNGFEIPFISKRDKIIMLPQILRLLFSSESTMRKLDDVSMTQTIEKYGKGKMKVTLEVFSRAVTTVNNLDRISTGEMFRAQRNLVKGSKPVGYPKQGLHRLSQTFVDIIKQNGGEIFLKNPVDKIIIDDYKAVGVVINDKQYFFKTIISNTLIQHLFTITDEKQFPPEYVRNIKALTGTGSLCAYYSLKKVDPNLLGKTFLFLERDVGIDGNDAVGMIDFMVALPESGSAPPSHHLVQSYIICTPDEAKNKKTLETLKKLLDKNLENLMPDFRSHFRWAIYPAAWHLDGVAKTIDNKKPDTKTPVENLYIVGDCVKAPGIGINCALSSARILCNILTSVT